MRKQIYIGIKKHRTIKQIHNLWQSSLLRDKNRRDKIENLIKNKIFKEVQPDKKGEYSIYYRHKNGHINVYTFNPEKIHEVRLTHLTNVTRQNKIKLLLLDKVVFKLGEEFWFLSYECCSRSTTYVFEKLFCKIRKYLEQNYTPTKIYDETEIIKIKIEDKKYLISAKYINKHLQLDWIGEDTIQTFEL